MLIRGSLWGPRFHGLLHALVPFATTAGMTSNAYRYPDDWLSRAEGHVVEVRELTRWPATISLSPVTHYTFAYSAAFVDLVFEQCRNPFRFQERRMPDNLHCLDPAGRVLLGTDSCGRSAWSQLTEVEWMDLVRQHPVLSSLRTAESTDTTTPDGDAWPGWSDPWLPGS